MKKLLTWIATASLCLLPSIASAAVPFGCYQAWMHPQERKYAPQGWFIGGGLGLQSVQSFKMSPEVRYDNSDTKVELSDMNIKPESGFQASFLWGYRYKGFRFESDFTLRRSEINKITDIPFISVPPGITDPNTVGFPGPAGSISELELRDEGVVNNISFMLNFFYDHYFESACVFPFFGLGVGLNVTTINANINTINTPAGVRGPEIDERSINFAIQIILGVGYVINDHWEVDLAYKYFMGGSDSFTLKKDNFNIDNNVAGTAQYEVQYGLQYDAQSIVLEFRWS